MVKQNTYCEIQFLERFENQYIHCSPFEEESVAKNRCWMGLYNFIRNKSTLLIDDKSKFNQLSLESQLVKKLKKFWAGGSLCIEEKRIELTDIPEDALCSTVFLFDDHPYINQLAESTGLFFITPSSYDQLEYLYKDNGQSLGKETCGNWSIFKERWKHHFNTIIISDLYILKEKRINLYAILDALLPSKLDVEMHISIFTTETPTFKKDYQDLVDYIKTIRPHLDFNLTLHKGMSADFHDRGIITNYIRMKCGAGFDLFKRTREGKQVARITTDVNIDYPYFIENDVSKDSYENILKDAKRMYKNNLFIGNKKNRLLTLS